MSIPELGSNSSKINFTNKSAQEVGKLQAREAKKLCCSKAVITHTALCALSIAMVVAGATMHGIEESKCSAWEQDCNQTIKYIGMATWITGASVFGVNACVFGVRTIYKAFCCGA